LIAVITAWPRYSRARQCQRDLTKAFAEEGIEFMHIDSQTHEKIMKEAIVADVASVAAKWIPILKILMEYQQKRDLLKQQMKNLGKPSPEQGLRRTKRLLRSRIYKHVVGLVSGFLTLWTVAFLCLGLTGTEPQVPSLIYAFVSGVAAYATWRYWCTLYDTE
jgi:sterol desaturase/sphingolipid hydroxylase (fatty acid hydroxylase superfamily)